MQLQPVPPSFPVFPPAAEEVIEKYLTVTCLQPKPDEFKKLLSNKVTWQCESEVKNGIHEVFQLYQDEFYSKVSNVKIMLKTIEGTGKKDNYYLMKMRIEATAWRENKQWRYIDNTRFMLAEEDKELKIVSIITRAIRMPLPKIPVSNQ